jgi:hypothetical protein
VSLGSLARVSTLGLAAFLVGATLGLLASIYHAAFFPFGLIAVLLAVGTALAGARKLFVVRYPALVISAGMITAITVLAGSDGQDSVLISANVAGYSLLTGIAVIIVFALAWPGSSPSSPARIEARQRERKTSP